MRVDGGVGRWDEPGGGGAGVRGGGSGLNATRMHSCYSHTGGIFVADQVTPAVGDNVAYFLGFLVAVTPSFSAIAVSASMILPPPAWHSSQP